MKKLISIGVAVALLCMVVLPVAVAADYTPPQTYAKVPFAIVQSGFELLNQILPTLLAEFAPDMAWITGLMTPIGGWAGGPLSWSVDMLAWGLGLGAEVWTLVNDAFDIGYPEIGTVLNTVSCKLLVCWSATNCTGTFDPCAGNST